MDRIKVNNPADYWTYDIEWDYLSWDSIKIGTEQSYDCCFFILMYYKIAHKYGILIPSVNLNQVDLCDYMLNNKSIGSLYRRRDRYFICPTVLFVQQYGIYCKVDSNFQSDINSPLIYVSNINMGFDIIYGPYILVKSDLFFDTIFTPHAIDNSSAAYLNSTRLNSFLRELEKLYSMYNLSLEFETGDYDTYGSQLTSKGYILIENEIIYYEDIYDLLNEECKYKKFENIDICINDFGYREFMELYTRKQYADILKGCEFQ